MIKSITYEDIKDGVEEIINRILKSEQFHGEKERFFLSARCMSYLYLEILKRFGIEIPEKCIVNNEFTDLTSICKIIYDKTKIE